MTRCFRRRGVSRTRSMSSSRAYYDLGGIDSIYANYGLETPEAVWLGLLGMEAALDIRGASYAQPSQGQQILPGAFLL